MGCILGNSVEERIAPGKKGGGMGMVFLSGFAFPVRGMKLLSAMGVNWIEIQVCFVHVFRASTNFTDA
jgi:hypothetical protein